MCVQRPVGGGQTPHTIDLSKDVPRNKLLKSTHNSGGGESYSSLEGFHFCFGGLVGGVMNRSPDLVIFFEDNFDVDFTFIGIPNLGRIDLPLNDTRVLGHSIYRNAGIGSKSMHVLFL